MTAAGRGSARTSPAAVLSGADADPVRLLIDRFSRQEAGLSAQQESFRFFSWEQADQASDLVEKPVKRAR